MFELSFCFVLFSNWVCYCYFVLHGKAGIVVRFSYSTHQKWIYLWKCNSFCVARPVKLLFSLCRPEKQEQETGDTENETKFCLKNVSWVGRGVVVVDVVVDFENEFSSRFSDLQKKKLNTFHTKTKWKVSDLRRTLPPHLVWLLNIQIDFVETNRFYLKISKFCLNKWDFKVTFRTEQNNSYSTNVFCVKKSLPFLWSKIFCDDCHKCFIDI